MRNFKCCLPFRDMQDFSDSHRMDLCFVFIIVQHM